MFDSLDLKITYNEDGEEGVYLTQEQLREQFIECRKTFNLSYELLAKMSGIDASILEAWELAYFGLSKEGINILLSVYQKLSSEIGTIQ